MLSCFFFGELVKGVFVEFLEAGGADGFGVLEQVGDALSESINTISSLNGQYNVAALPLGSKYRVQICRTCSLAFSAVTSSS